MFGRFLKNVREIAKAVAVVAKEEVVKRVAETVVVVVTIILRWRGEDDEGYGMA